MDIYGLLLCNACVINRFKGGELITFFFLRGYNIADKTSETD